MPRKKKIMKTEDPNCELCAIEGTCICEPSNSLVELSEIEVEPGLAELTLEPAPAFVEPSQVTLKVQAEVATEPEAEHSAGAGHWDVKYNLVRESKSAAARKYIPVHRQR
jgi:hypothetical protein